MLVGILGTTISPCLFFWQAAEEIEEERAKGKTKVAQRKGASAKELKDARMDTVIGMFFSNFIMYFIILTTGATLHAGAHRHGNVGSAGVGGIERVRSNGRR